MVETSKSKLNYKIQVNNKEKSKKDKECRNQQIMVIGKDSSISENWLNEVSDDWIQN